jgi:GT2 family glycosyltransferase
MCVYNQLDLTRACLASLRATAEPFELVVVDNGSTDDTPRFFTQLAPAFPLHYERHESNASVIARLNHGARLATTEFVCLLHNDTEMVEPAWLARLLDALGAPRVGLAGLYGAKRVRRDGRLVRRTIVHSLADGPTVTPPWEEVAFVDAVCLALSRRTLEAVGGLDEGYGFYHGLDRELSFAVREQGQRCVVVHAPFHHRGGGTRARDFGERPERERHDLVLRQEVMERFRRKWAHRLPADVRPPSVRIRQWIRAKLLGWRPPRGPVLSS